MGAVALPERLYSPRGDGFRFFFWKKSSSSVVFSVEREAGPSESGACTSRLHTSSVRLGVPFPPLGHMLRRYAVLVYLLTSRTTTSIRRLCFNRAWLIAPRRATYTSSATRNPARMGLATAMRSSVETFPSQSGSPGADQAFCPHNIEIS